MPYNLHIERTSRPSGAMRMPISLQEWRAAVISTKGVRLFSGEVHPAKNPVSGEALGIPTFEGDVEVFFPADGAWHPVFHWRHGLAKFAACFEPGDMSSPVWAAAVALASSLGAVIRGAEGETYDLRTGEVIDFEGRRVGRRGGK